MSDLGADLLSEPAIGRSVAEYMIECHGLHNPNSLKPVLTISTIILYAACKSENYIVKQNYLWKIGQWQDNPYGVFKQFNKLED